MHQQAFRDLTMSPHLPARRRAATKVASWLFWTLLLFTVGVLLTPGPWVLAVKVWVVSWLPWGADMAAFDGSGQADKLVHWALFAATAAAGAWARWAGGRRRLAVLVWGLLVVGVLTEVLQTYVPGRGPSAADWLADALGVAVGVAVVMWATRGRAGNGYSAGV